MSWRNAVAVASITLLASWPSRQPPAAVFEVAVDDPRPLARVLDDIEQRFGWTVTYEDPPYENANEIEDVTERVRRDGKTHPRVLVPRGGAFHFSYALNSENGSDAGGLLGALLARYDGSGNPGLFRVFREGNSFHVVPRGLIDKQGAETVRSSVLDSSIVLEPGHKNLEQVVSEIAAAAAVRARYPIGHGDVASNLLLQTMVRVDARAEPARTMLLRYLAATRRAVSWRLFYDPGMKSYHLNLRLEPQRG